MKELANISVYPFDTGPFGGSWEKVLQFHRSLGLDGMEVLTSFDGICDVPVEAVTAVHLPFWMDWMPLWLGEDLQEGPFTREERRYFRGGNSQEELVDNVRRYLSDASTLDPAYAVFHLCNTSVDEVLTGKMANGTEAVLDAAADLINVVMATFPGGEPPVRIFFENLWWEGLTFLDGAVAERFASSLHFSNWAFLLDTGHLLNTTTGCRDEEDAADYIIEVLGRLPQGIRRRIEGVHLSLSLSGALRESPDWNHDADGEGFLRRLNRAWEKMSLMDQHRPFTSSACLRVVEALEPDYLTHEFLCRTLEEREYKIRTQRRAMGRDI